MKLLLTNDDGIHAKGIYALCKELEQYHDITMVAPNDQRSATSHSITIAESLIVKEERLQGLKSKAYSVSGTPADCVRIGLNQLVDQKVDMVISGTNIGYNMGTDILYSGTVSAAVEATLCGIPAIAISTDQDAELEVYDIAAKYVAEIIEKAMGNKIEDDIVLNVNVPAIEQKDIKGMKVCKIGKMQYKPFFKETESSDMSRRYNLEGERIVDHIDESDSYYVNKGYVTITPLHYDLTNFQILKNVSTWF
ncbi:5'/3'-nucleotidase SurE [Vallitalea okinawensis]|uniref:5'/3'-nucleotidase SurE n=1 Tax=Vallitalea okinawensis TaxID=2078660 RepID=UPI000CFC86FC|nr:5'/3'-nucleotidase SurE [Vallitalea okinawensis]